MPVNGRVARAGTLRPVKGSGTAGRLTGPLLVALTLLGLALAGCGDSQPGAPRGDPGEGRRLIESYGCGSCHQIPGIRGASGEVGPRLKDIRSRGYLAGVLPNSFDNLVLWLTDTQRIAPGSAMPSLGISTGEAEDIAAYLHRPD